MFNTALNNNTPEKTGTVKAWGGSTAPSGWLFCDGSAISRTTYAALFAVIGTTYGSGDGTTTFNLPNFGGFSKNIPIGGNSKNIGIEYYQGSTLKQVGLGIAGNPGVAFYTTQQNKAISATDFTSITTGYSSYNHGVGLTTTAANSGMQAVTTSASGRAKAIIKY